MSKNKVQLTKPYINDPTVGYVSCRHLCDTLGPGKTLELYMDHEAEIVQLDSYKRIAEKNNVSLKLMFEFRKFERYLFEIDFPCWILFTTPKTVKDLVDRGYDGAIYANASNVPDFRIFNHR